MSTAFATLQDLKNNLVRKAVNGSVFAAPSTADAITAAGLFASMTGEIQALPSNWTTGRKADLGWMTDAGGSFARAISETPVTGWQSTSPVRSDRTADTTTLAVVCEETNLATIGLSIGVDESSITPASNGSVQIDEPTVPTDQYHRVLVVSEDTNISQGSVYICRFLPNAKVTDVAAQAHDKGDPITYGLTLTAFVDNTLGTAVRHLFGGPGWKALLADMGFNTDSSSSSS